MSRQLISLDQDWLYGGKYTRGSEELNFDDSAFQKVTIPHSNKIFPWSQVNNKDYEFVSIYRKHFKLPKEMSSKRVFVDFEGVSLMATVFLNGKKIGSHKGGYTPFSFEITKWIDWGNKNLISVKVDSRERKDIPPYGGTVDYLTYGGIYREVNLRIVDNVFIKDVFAKPISVLEKTKKLSLKCSLDGWNEEKGSVISASLYDDKKEVARQETEVYDSNIIFDFKKLENITLWDIHTPKLYTLRVRLLKLNKEVDVYSLRIGFREAVFTKDGFKLNGKIVKLHGLNRHQSYPYVGYAAPKRLQEADAELLKFKAKCNIVRTSHYPQSKHFLNRCDEIGLMVLEEMTGWHNIGDAKWKDIACDNLESMIVRDRNHPSVILWGVRINESKDDDEFYARTNKLVHELDDTRQTGGIRNFFKSNLLEDVFTINDFATEPLQKPNHELYLITEFCGHMFPTKVYDNMERVTEHTQKHADRFNQIYSDKRFAGGLAWCMCDYNTHSDFGSGDRICHHGIFDVFRFEKQVASFYKSQCSPKEEIVLEPIFSWSIYDWSQGNGIPYAMVCSNCDTIKFYLADKLIAVEKACFEQFGNLPYPPFICKKLTRIWGDKYVDLRIDGFIKGKKVASRKMSSSGLDAKFHLKADSKKLVGDGVDMTYLRFWISDEFGNLRTYAQGVVKIEINGPGEIIGDNPFALVGGRGAVLIKSKCDTGVINIKATHPVLGEKIVNIKIIDAEKERF